MSGRPAPAETQGHKEGKESVRTFLNLESREPGDEANTTHTCDSSSIDDMYGRGTISSMVHLPRLVFINFIA